jgi:hypothetical protein
MNECEWIICERTGRWAAAMRVTAARHAWMPGRAPRMYEVRSLEELADRLTARPVSLGLLEGHAANLGNVLRWLTDNSRRFPRAQFVALLDPTLGVRASSGGKLLHVDPHEVVDALFEAGAAEIAVSPRYLQHIFALADKHAAIVAGRERHSGHSESIAEWAWSLLPWQSDSA